MNQVPQVGKQGKVKTLTQIQPLKSGSNNPIDTSKQVVTQATQINPPSTSNGPSIIDPNQNNTLVTNLINQGNLP